MTIGLPHSSQSMSVAIGPLDMATEVTAAGFSPMIFAIRSCDFFASSARSGSSASTCLRSAPSSLAMLFIPRHLGNRLQPSHGPRFPVRKTSTPSPHLSHLMLVGIGLGLGGSGLPSLSRIMIVLHLVSPFSFLMVYPKQPRKS